jgi:hypothetical protein
MRILLQTVCLSLLLLLRAAYGAAPDLLVPRSHLLLLDVSGSMEREDGVAFNRYSSRFVHKLVEKLLHADGQYVQKDHPVVVLLFSHSGQPHPASAPIPAGQMNTLLAQIPYTAADSETDLVYALRRALEVIRERQLPEPVTIWMVTDNKPSIAQTRIEPLYERLRDDADFREIWFCPLADPEKGSRDALVLYTIVYSRSAGQPALGLMTEAGTRIGYESMPFKPLYTREGSLRFGRDIEYLDTSMEAAQPDRFTDADGRLNLIFREGEEVSGFLRFRIRSELKGWRITRASLEDGKAEVNIPDTYQDADERAQVTWKIGPKRDLAIDSQRDSINLYTLNLADLERPIHLKPRSFWTGVWSGQLPGLTGTVRLEAVVEVGKGAASGIEPQWPEAMRPRIAGVPNLDKIARFMVVQADNAGSTGQTRKLGFRRDVDIQVAISKARRYAALAILLSPLLLLAAAGAFLRLKKERWVLEGPRGIERFEMRLLGDRRELLDENGQAAATLARGFRGYTIEPLGGLTFKGKAEPGPLEVNQDGAEIELLHRESQRTLRYTLTRDEAPAQEAPGADE